MTQAEKLCADVSQDLKPQAMTLANAILAIQGKIEQQIPVFEKMPLAQTVRVGTGEKILRQNPAIAEFRALTREYAQALSNLKALKDETDTEVEIRPPSGKLLKFEKRFKTG